MAVQHADMHYICRYTSYIATYITHSHNMHECIETTRVVPRQVSQSPPQIATN